MELLEREKEEMAAKLRELEEEREISRKYGQNRSEQNSPNNRNMSKKNHTFGTNNSNDQYGSNGNNDNNNIITKLWCLLNR